MLVRIEDLIVVDPITRLGTALLEASTALRIRWCTNFLSDDVSATLVRFAALGLFFYRVISWALWVLPTPSLPLSSFATALCPSASRRIGILTCAPECPGAYASNEQHYAQQSSAKRPLHPGRRSGVAVVAASRNTMPGDVREWEARNGRQSKGGEGCDILGCSGIGVGERWISAAMHDTQLGKKSLSGLVGVHENA